MTLTLEQESANAIRKFSKARRRARDNDSPDKSEIKSKKKTKTQIAVHTVKNLKQERRELLMMKT